jgi:hypothetical protein
MDGIYRFPPFGSNCKLDLNPCLTSSPRDHLCMLGVLLWTACTVLALCICGVSRILLAPYYLQTTSSFNVLDRMEHWRVSDIYGSRDGRLGLHAEHEREYTLRHG